MRFALLCCFATACSWSSLEVVYEGEDAPYDDPSITLPVGAGLITRVSVFRVTNGFGYEDPDIFEYPTNQLKLSVTGGTLVPCGDDSKHFCVTADGTRDLMVSAKTPDGDVSGTRRVASNLQLVTYTPGWWGSAPVDAIQLETNTLSELDFVFREQSGGVVAGHAASYVATGPLTLSGDKADAGAPGPASIAAAAPASKPLSVLVVTHDQATASIARFSLDRVFNDGASDTSLQAYTKGSTNSFFLDAFDAGGFLVLPGLIVTATGPNLAPAGLTDGPCVTHDWCFLHPSLPAGQNELDTFIELSAGAADERIPVRIVRAAD